jgi:hypothetical protein
MIRWRRLFSSQIMRLCVSLDPRSPITTLSLTQPVLPRCEQVQRARGIPETAHGPHLGCRGGLAPVAYLEQRATRVSWAKHLRSSVLRKKTRCRMVCKRSSCGRHPAHSTVLPFAHASRILEPWKPGCPLAGTAAHTHGAVEHTESYEYYSNGRYDWFDQCRSR